MEYGKYKEARNAAWQCLIDYKIDRLPVKISDVAKKSNISIIKNSVVNILQSAQSGMTYFQGDKFFIVYNDNEPSERCRFTVAHELGHIFLGHILLETPKYRTFAYTDENESAANIFARDLLAPACVLHELKVLDANGISNLCNISLEAATYREKRMHTLEDRNAWYFHPLERKVYKQFESFINDKKNPFSRTS